MRYNLRRDIKLVLLLVALFILIYSGIGIIKEYNYQRQVEREIQNQQQEEHLWRLHQLEQQMDKQDKQLKELNDSIQKFLDTWNLDQFEVTAYAPLDLNAIEGMCYSGDPTITASGAKVIPGITVANGEFPFGTRVWIDSYG